MISDLGTLVNWNSKKCSCQGPSGVEGSFRVMRSHVAKVAARSLAVLKAFEMFGVLKPFV